MAQVTFDRVSKIHGTTKVLNDLSLEIADGEFMIFVGPSGCGKTTALRLLAGLDEISSGTISIDGLVVNEVSPSKRDIAMVFQNYALYPHMTVEKNLAFSLTQKKFGKDEIAQRVREASELLGLADLLQRKPKQLSGGQRQRVAVGRAIVRHPKIFLFDEPLSNLDAKLRVEMRAGITKLWQKLKTTFVYVTHDQIEAMTMATRIAVINQGHLQQIDAPVDLYRYPVNIFVASFIGSPSMNFFPGHLQVIDGRWQFDHGDGLLPLPVSVSTRWPHRDPPPDKVILGLRPEDIHDPNYLPAGTDVTKINAKVEVVEMMGSELFIHLSTVNGKSQRFVARTDSRSTCKVGELATLGFNLDNVHLFDAASGLALLPKPSARV